MFLAKKWFKCIYVKYLDALDTEGRWFKVNCSRGRTLTLSAELICHSSCFINAATPSSRCLANPHSPSANVCGQYQCCTHSHYIYTCSFALHWAQTDSEETETHRKIYTRYSKILTLLESLSRQKLQSWTCEQIQQASKQLRNMPLTKHGDDFSWHLFPQW